MGYSSSPSSSSNSRNKEMDEIMGLLSKYMELEAKRNQLIDDLNKCDSQIEVVMAQIKAHPDAERCQALLSGINATKTKR